MAISPAVHAFGGSVEYLPFLWHMGCIEKVIRYSV